MNKLVVVCLLVSGIAGTVVAEEPGAPPDWYLEEIATLTAGSGRWEADNSKYQSAEEPYDTYVTEWIPAFGGTVMRGRLFGRVDGKDSVDFWEFRLYWHPEKKHAVMEQFGWGGTVGIGTSWHEDGEIRSDQAFYGADGSVNRTGHVSHFPDSSTHVTASFGIEGDKWTPQREYTWHRRDE